jgi:putative spermidine/putrescine transport system ATP-binding protein
MSAALSLKGLGKRYEGADADAVAGFDLEVAAGEFVTLLGPSGSGKSTVLKMIAGFERPTTGEIRLGGTPITRLPPYRRGVGMVFQNYALFPHMTVADNVAFPLAVRDRPRAEIAAKVAAALRLVQLEELGERYPAQLSGGQQQRVALARAVVFDPPLLLMDEPLGALDRNLREDMKIEIKRVQRALSMTVIYVTHDQDEALAMSDRIAVLRGGQLIQAGPPRALYDRPADSFVARFFGESNLIEARLVRQGGAARAEVAGTMLPLPATAATPGDACLLLVRPERIRLAEPGATADGARLEGRVVEVTFLGESTRYRVAAGPLILTIKQQSGSGSAFAVGDAVAATWPAEATVLLDR